MNHANKGNIFETLSNSLLLIQHNEPFAMSSFNLKENLCSGIIKTSGQICKQFGAARKYDYILISKY